MEAAKRYENILVSLFFVAWGSVSLDRTAGLYLAPYFAPQFHLTSTQIGMLASALSITWAISSLLLAALSDRLGRRTLLIPAIFIFSIFSWASGLAQNFDQLLAIRAIMGIAGGGFFSVMSALIEESSHPTRRGRNVGFVISAAALVGLAVSPVLATQIAAHYSWRWAFFASGVPGIIMGFVIWKFVKEPERHAEQGGGGHGHVKLADYFQILRYRNMWLACFAAAGTLGWLFLQNVFAPVYITKVAHQPATTAGFLLGATGLGSFVLGFIFPALSDRIGRKETLLILAALSTVVPIVLMIPSLYSHLWLLAAILFLTNGHLAIMALVLVLIPTESVPHELAATAIGLAVLVGEILGATLSPTLAGALAVRYGLGVTLWMSAGGSVLVFFLALFLKRTGPEIGVPATRAAVAG
ncbi:MAG TPA: MFS transporter [Patescibacteria group bacterium]|nr:MFS transporter [Patescibacteria group bacterium]